MKKIMAILLIVVLVFISGCSSPAVPAESPADVSEAMPEVSAQGNVEGNSALRQGRPADFAGRDNQNGVYGKITAISGTEITLAVGTISRPEGAPEGREGFAARDGSRPDFPDDASRPDTPQSRPDRQRDGSMPQGDRPSGGSPGFAGGGFPGGSIDLEYSGEEVSYAISDSVVITKGMGQADEALSFSDLAEGDVIRLVLDEDGKPVSIQIFEVDK